MVNYLTELLNIGSQVEGRVGGAGGSPDSVGPFQPPVRAVSYQTQAITRADVNKRFGLGDSGAGPVGALDQVS